MSRQHEGRWQFVPLGALAEFRNGVNFSKANFGNGIKVIGVGDFQNNVRASFDSLEQINPDGVVRKEHLLQNGDILFVRSNGNRDLIGRSMFVAGVSEEVTHSAFSIRLRFVSDACHPRFYAYLFRSRLMRKALSLHGGGTNISNLNQDILARLKVPLPPKAVQCKVASILSAYDDLIENNTRRIKILEEMAQMIYREWFVNFQFPGHENVRMRESDIGRIPVEWSTKTIGDVTEIVGGGTPSTDSPEYWDGDIMWYSPSDLTAAKSLFMFTSSKKITDLGLKKSSARLFPSNSVMMTSRATIGVVAINTTPACTNQGFITCVPGDRISHYEVYFWLLENMPKIVSLASGATFKEINKRTFRELNILVPTSGVRSVFVGYVTPIFNSLKNLLQRNTNLRITRDLLLPKLVSGEVSVQAAEREAAAEGA
jgi:type I restriction enzyme S subunit